MPPSNPRYHLGLWAFVAAMLIYAATRIIALSDFPIYFFSDEAIQAVSAAELLRDNFRNSDGLLWPPYFKNYAVWNLSLSVYLQLLPVHLFGMSVFVTRLVSVWVGLLGVAAVAGALRRVFRARGWYLSVLVLATTPAWFIHSRTAFETAEMVAFYALFLYSYLLFRTRPARPWRYAFAALLFAAAAFYSYSNGQAIIGLLGLALLVVDAPYHWRVAFGEKGRKGEGEKGSALSPFPPFSLSPLLLFLAAALLLAWPYVRFRQAYPTDLTYHLRSLDSYWFHDAPLAEKMAQFADRYAYGLSPAYWFRANDHDLIRHRFGPVAHMRPIFLPLLLLGIGIALARTVKGGKGEGEKGSTLSPFPPFSLSSAAYRALLLALLAAPVGAALVNVAVTRVLSVVVPVTLLVGVGVDWVWRLLGEKGRKGEREKGGKEAPFLPFSLSPLLPFLLLTLMSVGTLRYALSDGPRWFEDYTMGGMQYGAGQLFPLIRERLAVDPTTTILLSPDWANGTDMFPRFFLPADEQRRVRTLNVDAFISEQLPLDDTMLFIMLPAEAERALQSGKFRAVTVEESIPYPNGQPGFLLARMAYVDGVEAVFAAELEALRRPVSESIALADGVDGEDTVLTVTHTRFEAGQLSDLFDGDTFTLVRHIAGNPVRYEIVFEEPRPVTRLAADLGTMDFTLTATLTPPPDAPGEPATYTADFIGLGRDPHVDMPFPDPPPLVAALTLEIHDINAGEDVKIHVRELRVMSDE